MTIKSRHQERLDLMADVTLAYYTGYVIGISLAVLCCFILGVAMYIGKQLDNYDLQVALLKVYAVTSFGNLFQLMYFSMKAKLIKKKLKHLPS